MIDREADHIGRHDLRIYRNAGQMGRAPESGETIQEPSYTAIKTIFIQTVLCRLSFFVRINVAQFRLDTRVRWARIDASRPKRQLAHTFHIQLAHLHFF